MFEPLASDIACGSIHDHEFYRLRKILVSAVSRLAHVIILNMLEERNSVITLYINNLQTSKGNL